MVKIDNKNLHNAHKNYQIILAGIRDNARCLYSGCNEEPCLSHIISRSTLTLIAEKGMVKTWRKKSSENLVKLHHAYTDIAQLAQTEDPVSVSIGSENIHDTVTYPLFCGNHDKDIFKPIEDGNPIVLQPPNLEQIFLLQYRAASSIVFDTKCTEEELDEINPHAQKHHLYKVNPQVIAALQQSAKQKGIYKVFSRCEKIRNEKQFDQIDCQVHLVDIPHCIAATYGFMPSNDNHVTYQKISLKDYVFFTFLPYTDKDKSIAIFSWLKGSKQAEKFLDLHQFRAIDKQKEHLLLDFAFKSPNLYISTTWWKNRLSDQKREYYKQIRTGIYKESIFSLFSISS